MRADWVFALPPSVPDSATRTAQVRTALSTVGCREVKTALTYGLLLDDLAEGKVHVAWAPPLLSARLEGIGARVLLRAVRGGATSYRAVVFARADRKLELGALQGKSAAWLDQRSMSGYVLPRALLAQATGDVNVALRRESFLGSYHACVNAVLDGRVDVSATFATSASASVQRLGFVDLAGPRAGELTALGFSEECPNDALLLSPRVQGAEADEFVAAFRAFKDASLPARALATALEVDAFEDPVAGTYRHLAAALMSPGAP
jgi:ABC-type phosphate/phosphonate transport system substrate-binding protein